jgi:hypothetical protein
MTQWLMKQLSKNYDTKITVESIDVNFFKGLILKKLTIEDQQRDTLFAIDRAALQLDSMNLLRKKIYIGNLDLQNSLINIKKDSLKYNFQFLLNSSDSTSSSKWQVSFKNIYIKNSKILFHDFTSRDTIKKGIDFKNIGIDKLNLSIVDIQNSDSVKSFSVDHASIYEKSGFNIPDLHFKARIDSSGFRMTDLMLLSNHSHFNAKSIKIIPNKLFKPDSLNDNNSILNRYIVDGDFKESVVSLADLAYILPDLWGMNEPVLFSGNVYGTLNNIKLKKINVKIGKNTLMNADLEMKGLPDWKNTYIYFRLYENVINFKDLAAIRMPENYPKKYLDIPKPLLKDLKLTYQGNFSGFPTDFVAYGTVDGDLGRLSTDIAIKPKKSDNISFTGNLQAKSFKAGTLLNYKPLGDVSLNLKVNGIKSAENKFNMTIVGNIDSLYLHDYRIDSIYVDGKASEKSFEGNMTVQDNNLKMIFSGIADLSGKIPVFNFNSTVENADLFALGLDKNHKNSKIAFSLLTNFSGDYFDNINGQINLKDFSFTRDDKTLNVNDLTLKTTNSPDINTINLRSDIADIDIQGKYLFREFDLTFRDYISHFLPSINLPFSDRSSTGTNSLNFDIRIKEAEELGAFFIPGLEAKSPIAIKGSINSLKNTFNLEASAAEILYRQAKMKDLYISSHNVNKQWLFRAGTNEIVIGKNLKIQNLSMNNSMSNDSIKTSFTWNNTGTPTYSGKIDVLGIFSKNKSGHSSGDFIVNHSNIWVADSLWQIDQNRMHLDSTSLSVSNFNIHRNNESFNISGNLSEDVDEKLNILFKQVRLGNLDLVLDNDIGIDGVLNGRVSIANPYHSFYLTSDLKLSGFTYLDKNFGDILIENEWDKDNQRLNSSFTLVKDKKTPLVLKGFYDPESKEIDYNSTLKDFPLETLFPFLSSFSNKVEGTGNGSVKIRGPLSDPDFRGSVAVNNAVIGIDYTKVAYSFNDTVRFAGDSIIFANYTLKDKENNKGLFNGVITHHLFGRMTYDMNAVTNKILALNTTAADNDLFYGTAHCSGNISLKGAGIKLKMTSDLKTEAGTQINIPLENPETVNEYNFIRFVNPDTLIQKPRQFKRIGDTNDFELDMNLTAANDARIQMLFNSNIGDAINGQGSGNLRFIYDKEGDFYIYGDYEIEKGDYMFVLQNVIQRKFNIERGGLISFNGDIYNAQVDLDATYNLRTQVTDLLPGNNQNENPGRIPVQCKINLSKKLFNPVVKFDILFPTVDERTKDELQQYLTTQDDVNRQMLSLMVMGQFYTPEYLRGKDFQSNTSNLVGSTTSDILSNYLSNWLSQISNDFDIGFKYRPGDQVNTDQMEVALSTQIFNDKVTINGNIGNNSRLQSNTTNPVVGEVEVYVKLSKSGKLQLKAYNRANDDLIYDTSLYKQGVGLSFREEFNSLSDLFNFYKPRKKKLNLEKKQEISSRN